MKAADGTKIAEDLQQDYALTIESLPTADENSRRVLGQVKYYVERISRAEERKRVLREEMVLARDSAAELYPRLVVCAIILREGMVLLEKRAPAGVAGLDGSWDLPGGKVECRESVHDAVVREIQEELGVTIHCDRLLSEPLQSVWKYGEVERHWLLVGCVCSIVRGEPQLSEYLQWHPLNTLPQSLLPADRQFIAAALNPAPEQGKEAKS